MLKNNILTAWRNIRRNTFYSALNITGLAIGLAVGILILLWVRDETSYDGFHKQADHIYKINSHIGSDASARTWNGAPAPLAVFARHAVPEVSRAVRIMNRNNRLLVTSGKETFLEGDNAFADPDFFSIFDFPLIRGDRRRPFIDDHSVVITETMVR